MRLLSALLPALIACAPSSAREISSPFGVLRFEENRGQADARVRYFGRAKGQQVFLTEHGIELLPSAGPPVRMTFTGAAKPIWTPLGDATESISYFIGNDRAKWVNGAPVFDRVAWRAAYPGIDIIVYGRGDQLEYDLVLAPGADPRRVRLTLDGATRIRTDSSGAILIDSGAAVIKQRSPELYEQDAAGNRRRVEGRFVRAGSRSFRLETAAWDRSKTLVVDPVLEAATYLGGENDDELIAVAEGIVAGNTQSVGFPGDLPRLRRSRDVFVRGTGPVAPTVTGQSARAYYGTVIIGGSEDDELAGISVQPFGTPVVYAVGTTRSRDFPTTGGSQYKGGASDGFAVSLVFSQFSPSVGLAVFLGGSGEDRILAHTGSGSAMAFAGVTDSPDLPVAAGTPQRTLAGRADAFYAYGFSLTALTWGYLGGSGDDAAHAIAVRTRGTLSTLWIGGETRSADFPFEEPGLVGASDAFLTEVAAVSATEHRLVSRRIGGSGEDAILALIGTPANPASGPGVATLARHAVLDGIGIAGRTNSADLPVRNAAQPALAGETDAFAGYWDINARGLSWLTYLGGSGPDEATCIAQNWAGDLYLGGWTRSGDMPVVSPLQTSHAGGEDGIFAFLDIEGKLQHLSYYGGSGNDRVRGVAVIVNNVARVVGVSTSTDLPELQSWGLRGQRSEGFVADIGTDQLSGPAELILAKDGELSFSIRAGRSAYRVPVTYRSSDPSRVRFVYLGRSVDEVTAAADSNMIVEALGDSGEVALTATAPGFAAKTIRVRLYPGVFVSSVPTAPIVTWASDFTLFATYRAIDPATDQLVGPALGIRSGATIAAPRWSSSDPGIAEIVSGTFGPSLRVLRTGETTITLTVDGQRVIGAERTITVAAPDLFIGSDLRIAQDMQANLPGSFQLNGTMLFSGYRGTLTARSSDPSRLLLSPEFSHVGRESVTIRLIDRAPQIWAQALAGEGEVQVYFTSTEFEGERSMTVTLERPVLRWGQVTLPSAIPRTYEPAITLPGGTSGAQLGWEIQSESGQPLSGRRPGAPPLILRLNNSNPRVLELNRLTLSSEDPTSDGFKLTALSPGVSELSISVAPDNVLVPVRTVPVTVTPRVPNLTGLPASVVLGKDLQTEIVFRYYPPVPEVTVFSDDAAAVLVSTSAGTRGSAQISVGRYSTSTDEYRFHVQALRSEGQTRVRLRFSDGTEREIAVTLVPSAPVISGTDSPLTSGYSARTKVSAWAHDPVSGVAIRHQVPMPGVRLEVRLSVEGAPVRISRDSLVLTTEAAIAEVEFTRPEPGQQAVIVAQFASGGPTARFPVQTPATGPVIGETSSIVLSRDELRHSSFYSCSEPLTATTKNPQLVLVSASATESGSESTTVRAQNFYLHALSDTGTATVQIECGTRVWQLLIGLVPLQVHLPPATVARGATVEHRITFSASSGPRPGAAPFRFTLRTADPSIATVRPETIEFTSANAAAGVPVQITGITLGTTRLLAETPPEVYAAATAIRVGDAPGIPALPTYTLGRDLQGSLRVDLGTGVVGPAVVTLTSSDPRRILLSRSATTPGNASVNLAVAAGDRYTQTFYVQALEGEGEVELRVSIEGQTRPVTLLRLVPSWFACSTSAGRIDIVEGTTHDVQCSARFTDDTRQPVQSLSEIDLRAGFDDVTLNATTSSPGVFTVAPSAAVWTQRMVRNLTLRGLAVGEGELRIEQPAGFGPAPAESEVVRVRVVLRDLPARCSESLVVGKDMQVTCAFELREPVTITATSEDPALLLVSTDPRAVGAGAAAATGTAVGFALQSLSAWGTVEVVFTAPGYRELRLPVVLRRADLFLDTPMPLTLQAGSTVSLNVTIRVPGTYGGTLRAGANVPVEFSASPAGVIAIEPTRLTLTGGMTTPHLQVRGLAPGRAILSLAAPQEFVLSETPLAVVVR
jgi:hypothetical protein